MSAPPLLACRQAVVRTMAEDAVLTATTIGDRIYGERTEPKKLRWPFIRCDGFDAIPQWQVSGLVHIFSKGPFADEAHTITEIVAQLFDARSIDLQNGSRAFVNVDRSRIIPDGAEADAWHGIVSLTMNVPKDCLEA